MGRTILSAIVVAALMTAGCGAKPLPPGVVVSFTWEPPFVPLQLTVDSDWNLTVTTEKRFTIPVIGRVTIGASGSIPVPDNGLRLVIRDKRRPANQVDAVYVIHGKPDIVYLVTEGRTVTAFSRNEIVVDVTETTSFYLTRNPASIPAPSASRVPTSAPPATATSRPATSIPPPTVTVNAAPQRPQRPTFRGQNTGWVSVANTDGQGVFVRDTGTLMKLKAWPDGTMLELIGDDVERDSQLYTPVRDPDGRQGLVPSQYLVAAARPAAPPTSAPQRRATTPPAPQTPAEVKPPGGRLGEANMSGWCRTKYDTMALYQTRGRFPESSGWYCVVSTAQGSRDIPVDFNDVCRLAFNNPRATGRYLNNDFSPWSVDCSVP